VAKVNRKLTEVEIRNAKPHEKDYRLYDADGLTLLIRKSGTKVWQYRYKYNSDSNIYTFGKVGEVDSSAAVRAELIKVKEQLTQGLDPNQEKKLAKVGVNDIRTTTHCLNSHVANCFAAYALCLLYVT
jgi:hypothetical protein